MLPALRDSQRQALLRLSILLCCGAVALLPLTARSSFDASAEAGIAAQTLDLPNVPDRLQFPQVAIARDPFAPDAALTAASFSSDDGVTGMSVQAGDDIGIVLPPNAGASGVASMPGDATTSGAPTVRAVVVGPSSRALVDLGGHVRVFAVGDAFGPTKITAIDASGVTLANGIHLHLAEEHQQ